jgi:hypothetical protein
VPGANGPMSTASACGPAGKACSVKNSVSRPRGQSLEFLEIHVFGSLADPGMVLIGAGRLLASQVRCVRSSRPRPWPLGRCTLQPSRPSGRDAEEEAIETGKRASISRAIPGNFHSSVANAAPVVLPSTTAPVPPVAIWMTVPGVRSVRRIAAPAVLCAGAAASSASPSGGLRTPDVQRPLAAAAS